MIRIASGILVAAAAAATSLVLVGTAGISPSQAQMTAPPAANACSFPTRASATPQETAWRLFVAANCTAGNGKLVWENWIEQSDYYPTSSGKGSAVAALSTHLIGHRLHGSPLALALRAIQAAPGNKNFALALQPATQCNPMSPAFLPANVVSTATICEETHLNPDTTNFISSKGYQLRGGQAAAAQHGTDIQFSNPSIEVKVDWIPATDFKNSFSCSAPPPGVHVETFDGVCYAMVGMHISSKLLKDWLWATFEPQSMLTNPGRCVSYGPCHDSWGSVPAISYGGSTGFTQQSGGIAKLMKGAKLAAEFANYRLDGAQVDFVNKDGTPTLLGNSVIEGENAGVLPGRASCITCHSVSSVKADGSDGIRYIGTPEPIGIPFKPPAQWVARDFVWSLFLACPNSPTQRCDGQAGGK